MRRPGQRGLSRWYKYEGNLSYSMFTHQLLMMGVDVIHKSLSFSAVPSSLS